MDNYSQLFDDIVAVHLHQLVKLIGRTKSYKILFHEWILGVEKNYRKYVFDDDDKEEYSEFVPRLSFRIGGLRDEFKQAKSKSKIIDLLLETFDISTYCYFDYGAREDIAKQIETYCVEVDKWMGEKILLDKYKRFKFSQKAIPSILSSLNSLKVFGSNIDESKYIINEQIEKLNDLEKEFIKISKSIVQEYVLLLHTNKEYYDDIKRNLNKFFEECKSNGYGSEIMSTYNDEMKKFEFIKQNESLLESNFYYLKSLDYKLSDDIINLDLKKNTLSELNKKFKEICTLLLKKYVEMFQEHSDIYAELKSNLNYFIISCAKQGFEIKLTTNDEKEMQKNLTGIKLTLVNIFFKPLKNTKVNIVQKNHLIISGKTNDIGEIILDGIPKANVDVILIDKNRVKKINVNQNYYENKLWFFCF
jgi:hypothetical protein